MCLTVWKRGTAHLRHCSKEIVYTMLSSFTMPKGSPLKVSCVVPAHLKGLVSPFTPFQKLFRNSVYRLHAAGLMFRLRDDVLQTRRDIPLPHYRFKQPLNLTQLSGSFAVLLIGLLLSVTAFLCELFKVRSNDENLKNRNFNNMKGGMYNNL